MKKITFLLILLCSTLSFGQNLITNGGFENFTGGLPDDWSNEAGAVPSQETTTFTEGTSAARYSVNTQSQANTDVRQSIDLTSGITYDVSFDVYQVDNKSRARMFNGGFGPYSDPDKVGEWQTVTDTYTASADETVEFGLRFYDISSNWDGTPSEIIIDNFQVVAQTTPSISITAPTNSSTITTTSIDIEIAVTNFNVASGGTGDGYIIYTLDSDPAVDKFDTNPIALTGLSASSHTVTVELVDNSGASLSPTQTATVSFTVVTPTPVADLNTLRQQATTRALDDYYTISEEVILTFQQDFRGQKFIEDSSGAILIDDTAGTITTIYNVGDGITGITGQLTEFEGQLQLIPTEDPGAATSTGNNVDPQIITVAELAANPENYESELVAVADVTVDNTPSTTWDNGTEYTITQNTDTFMFRTTFFDVDYIGQTVPTTSVNIVGLITERNNGSYFISARDSNDFPANLSIAQFDDKEQSLSIYPNPVYDGVINFPALEKNNAEIKIFNILGAEVASKRLNNSTSLNVSNLTPGVYLVQLFENNKRVTTDKLIIR